MVNPEKQEGPWQDIMKSHAKSFYLASLFFPRRFLPKVKALYALCRRLDDAVDEVAVPAEGLQTLNTMAKDLESPRPQLVINQMYRRSGLDIGLMQDLIQGAKGDINCVRIQHRQGLIQYCYQVAGAVGLAMFDLMEIQEVKARANAVDLGLAMQITNICRDVKEDLEKNRIYIPLELLNRHHIQENHFVKGSYREEQFVQVIREMLQLADRYYQSARSAFLVIPWRLRGAIIIASLLYQSIGHKLLRQGGNPMKGRIYLSWREKGWIVLRGLGYWLISTFQSSQLNHDPHLHSGLEKWQILRRF